MILCSQCHEIFDNDEQVEAQFLPDVICEDCLEEDDDE